MHYVRFQRSGLLEPLDRFWPLVAKGTFCWQWTGTIGKGGYGKFGPKLAHRISYEKAYGPIPEGMTVDHLCRNPGCVNPGHLRLLPPSENFSDNLQGRRDRCGNGHLYTRDNLRIRIRNGHQVRDCRACDRERQAASKARHAERQEVEP